LGGKIRRKLVWHHSGRKVRIVIQKGKNLIRPFLWETFPSVTGTETSGTSSTGPRVEKAVSRRERRGPQEPVVQHSLVGK